MEEPNTEEPTTKGPITERNQSGGTYPREDPNTDEPRHIGTLTRRNLTEEMHQDGGAKEDERGGRAPGAAGHPLVADLELDLVGILAPLVWKKISRIIIITILIVITANSTLSLHYPYI